MSKASPPPPQHKRLGRAPRPITPGARRVFTGIPVSAGVAIGPVFGASEPVPEITRHKIQASRHRRRRRALEAAIAQSRKQLGKLRARLAVLPEESQAEIAPLIDAYIRMLGPSRMIRGVRRRIEETLVSAETAVMAEAEAIAGAILAQAEPGMPADDRAGLMRRADEIARDRPSAGAQPDPGAISELRRPPRGGGTGRRVVAAFRCSVARPVAPGRRRHRGGWSRGPHLRHAARAGCAGRVGCRRSGACDPSRATSPWSMARLAPSCLTQRRRR